MFLGTVRRQYTSISFFFDPLPPFGSVFCDWLLFPTLRQSKSQGAKCKYAHIMHEKFAQIFEKSDRENESMHSDKMQKR